MAISLKAMRYYCAVLRHGTIAQAADEMNVAASAVAAALDQIEDHFQLSLTIRRRARGIAPTADGRLMAQRFQTLLEEYDALLRDGSSLRQSLAGDLRVGYYAPVAPAFLPTVLKELVTPEHDITLHLEAQNNADVQLGLKNGIYDAILFVSNAADPDIVYNQLVEAPPYCLMAEDHPLAGQQSVRLRDITRQQIVTLQRPLIGEYYQKLFDTAEQKPQILAQCNSTEMVRSLVGATNACAILNMVPFTNVTYAGHRLVARPIHDPLPSLSLSVGYRRGRQRRAVSEFIRLCRAYFDKSTGLTFPSEDPA